MHPASGGSCRARPICRVHADASMFVGGLRALLLQSLHPLAMAGIAQHSDYRHDPWGRLQRTADFIAATTFGPAAEAERAVAIVRRVHEHVNGVAPDGRPYSALDPHLLRWVHLAEIDSFLAAHTHYGNHPLEGSDRDEYVAQTAFVARKLGRPRTARVGTRTARPAPFVPAGAEGDPRGARGGAVPARAATDAARRSPGVPRCSAPPRSRSCRGGHALRCGCPYMPIAERVALRPAGEAVTRTLRWALARRPTDAEPD